MTRIPLATDLKTRTGAPDKDARLTNCYVETRGDQSVVRKRAVAHGGVSVGTGVAQGGIAIGMTFPNSSSPATAYDTVIMVKGDSLRLVIKIPVGGKIIWKSAEDISVAWSMFLLSCGAYVLPDDDNRGTVQYSGPFETYPQAPLNSISYVDIAETNCGTYRKKITKTYKVRTEPNQYKAFLAGGGGNAEIRGSDIYGYLDSAWAAAEYPPENYLKGYGSTSIAARENALSKLLGVGTYTITSGADVYVSTVTSVIEPTSTSREFYGTRTKNGSPYGSGLLYTAYAYDSDLILTLYYIDETEVWSYEIA